METISYLNLKVEGVPFTKILKLDIMHSVNQHAVATLVGEAETDQAESFVQRVDDTTKVMIKTTAEGQPDVLFYGIVSSVGMKKQDSYVNLELELHSTSALLDVQKQNKSFQNLSMTHEAVLNQVLKGKALLHMAVTDRPIGSLIMQYQETPWEFIKRIAAVFHAPVITNVTTEKPEITIGMPAAGRTYQLSDVEYQYGNDSQGILALGEGDAMKQDFSGTGVTGNQYMFLGDTVTVSGQSRTVKSLSATLQSGILKTTVFAAKEKGFTQPAVCNQQVSGKIFKGIVQAVKKDKVQVHLCDIDSEYDGGGSCWLPYSTAYSSGDGSGFYCMPAEGDTVRVFFPSGSEGEAFAASSVNVSPLDNPKHKKWKSPEGKEILMTEEGIFITCKEGRVFINLTDGDGITITSEQDINICSKNNVTVMANNQVLVQADNNILLSTGESYIDMKKTGIELGANNVTIL